MPTKEELIDYFFTMYGDDIVDFTNELKEECNQCGMFLSNNTDPNHLLDLLIKTVECV